MSLVICSNLVEDKTEALNDQSINEAFAFRNELSSTHKIPANSQVAVQSVKVNVDGRVVVGKDNGNFYQYFGERVEEGVDTLELMTSKPVITRLIANDEQDKVLELTKKDLAGVLQERMRATTYHPNQKGKTIVVSEDVADEGFTFKFDSNNSSANERPTEMSYFGNTNAKSPSTAFVYNNASKTFTRNLATNKIDLCTGIAREFPISCATGEFVVNIGEGNGNANASGVEWLVGLSRSVNQQGTKSVLYTPPYWGGSKKHDAFINSRTGGGAGFVDFAVARNKDNELLLFHSVCNASNNNKLTHYEVKYYNNTNSIFKNPDKRLDLSAAANSIYTRVKFEIKGEQVGAYLYNSSSKAYDLITEYSGAQSPTDFFKPVNQACWCLHPVLSVGHKASNLSSSLEIASFTGLKITGYSATDGINGGWYEAMEHIGSTNECFEVESRSWGINQTMNSRDYVQLDVNSSGGVDYEHVMIVQKSNLFTGTGGANARRLLGFERGVIDYYTADNNDSQHISSDTDPDTTTTQALFVRLNNFGQKVLNARMGNRSNIICHLPRFDNSFATGRLHFEPNNLMYLDLGNPFDLNVNEFDISFCYMNEQFAKVLTGQSIVALHFREKPKE